MNGREQNGHESARSAGGKEPDRRVGPTRRARNWRHPAGRVQRSGELVRSVRVEAALLAEGAESVGSSIRFTPELLDDLTNRAKVEHPAFQVVGWFHTHNGLGAFFSSYDTLVHKEYFPLPWQIALVSDPELGNEGIYVWQNQELVPYEGESDAEWYSLIPTGSPRYRLVNPGVSWRR